LGVTHGVAWAVLTPPAWLDQSKRPEWHPPLRSFRSLSQGLDRSAALIDLDAIPGAIADDDPVLGVDRDAQRARERALPGLDRVGVRRAQRRHLRVGCHVGGGPLAELRVAGQRLEQAAVCLVNLDEVSPIVRDVDVADAVDVDTGWSVEAALA